MSILTKKVLVTGCSAFVFGVLLAGSYKLGAHHQAQSDRSSFTNYLSFVEQQDTDDCKDEIEMAAHLMTKKCEAMLEEQCPTMSKAP